MIYVLRAEELGRVKIGFSKNVPQRLARIRDGAPSRLALIAVAQGNRRDEAALHKAFAFYRVHGEWFSEVGEVEEFCFSLASSDSPRDAIDVIINSRAVQVPFDLTADRVAMCNVLNSFISVHGSQKFCEISKLSPQMERLVRTKGAVISAIAFNRLVAFDPLNFVDYFGFDLRRLHREIGALICRIEDRRAAA